MGARAGVQHNLEEQGTRGLTGHHRQATWFQHPLELRQGPASRKHSICTCCCALKYFWDASRFARAVTFSGHTWGNALNFAPFKIWHEHEAAVAGHHIEGGISIVAQVLSISHSEAAYRYFEDQSH